MQRLIVTLSFATAVGLGSTAFADVPPGPPPRPHEEPPSPEPTPEQPPEEPPSPEHVRERPPEEPPQTADVKQDDTKKDDAKKSGNCSVRDDGHDLLALAALVLLVSGAALRRRNAAVS